MIQRIQTLFLLAAMVLLSVDLFMPLWKTETKDKKIIELNVFEHTASPLNLPNGKVETLGGNFYIASLVIASLLLTGFVIIKFNNRSLQLKLSMLNNVILCGIIAAILISVNAIKGNISYEVEDHYSLFFIFPALCIMLNFLAMRYIKKDDDLVKSADRIR